MAVQRLRLAAISLGLVILVFAQSAGQTAADTKIDLVVDPSRFLHRALTLWDPIGAAGQLQNQAYGYLFPMGPFFVLGKFADLPAWEVQRAWESALLVAAFLGVVRLARLLGTVAFWPKVAAGLVYAVAPRMLSELGSISSELMPVAALPWVMIPLVTGSVRGSPRRAGLRAGVALLFAGGVNAAATLAVLPVPVLWLLTRSPGVRRRLLTGWFAVGVLLASAWWLIPLVLLGRYSPPFLDWIESSQVTTGVTSLIASLRGVDHWQAYLGPSVWPAGWILVAVPAAIIATAAVAAAGLAGLARRDLPNRVFWCGCLVLGLVLVTMGYSARVGPPAGSLVRSLLDGPLNAFRNVHKFDPLIRLPLAIGVGHLISRLRVPGRLTVRRATVQARPLALMTVLAVGVLAISPAITNNLIPQARPFTETSWWQQTGQWLGSHEGSGRALVLPGASRPTYLWGSTVDDALQPVATGPWTVRDGIPLTPAGYIRLLDDLSLRIAAGQRDDMLPVLLARAGIRYLVVRNDLDTVASGATNLAFVHATIANTPGLPLVASFGPDDRFPGTRSEVVDLGATRPYPAVQVYRVADWSGEVGLLPAAATVAATGSSDELGALIAAGITPATPVLFGADARAAAGLSSAASAVTDGIPRREAAFGQAGVASETMSAGQPYRQARSAHDYLPESPGPLSTVAYGGGVTDVLASSSGADPGSLINPGSSNGPWSAIDGDPTTAWKSSAFTGANGQWLSVELARPLSVPVLQLAFAAGLGGYPNRIRVSTDSGQRDTDVTPGPLLQNVQVPPGPTQSLRITILAAEAGTGSVGLSTVAIPGTSPSRTLVVPTGGGSPDVLSFATELGGRSNCLTVAGRAACDPSFAASGESDGVIDRTFTLSEQRSYQPSATVRLQPGAALDALLDAGRTVRATASSVDDPDPRERAGAAVDGDPTTGWVAARGDPTPSLVLDLGRNQVVSTIGLQTDPAAPTALPQRVEIGIGGHRWQLAVPSSGLLTLPQPVRARTLKITVLRAELRTSTSTLYQPPRLLPVGINEILINGKAQPRSTNVLNLPCFTGLNLIVDGTATSLQASATRAQALSGQLVTATPCSAALTLAPGRHEVRLGTVGGATPATLTLTEPGLAIGAGANPGSVTPLTWGAARRTVRVTSPQASVLVVRENANDGWQATSSDGRVLAPVRVDGWQQGWLVPAGLDGTVTLRFRPQQTFQLGLLAGLLAVIALLGMALAWRDRRVEAPAVAERKVSARWLAGLALLGSAVLAGVIGVAAAGIAVLTCWLAVRREWRIAGWAASVPLLLAALAEAWRPSGKPGPLAGSGWVQTLCVIAICCAVAGGAGLLSDDGRVKRRRSGRSSRYQDSAPSTVDETAVSRNSSR
jgi:arabinofuranan 3-O-arabinosyltransferase